MTKENSPSPTPAKLQTATPVIAGSIASLSDLPLHVFDTVKARLQYSQIPMRDWKTFEEIVLLKQRNSTSQMISALDLASAKRCGWKSLFNGISWAALDKGFSRTYRFAIQEKLQNLTAENLNPAIQQYLTNPQLQTIDAGVSGALTGLSGTILLKPFETMKTRAQLNVKIEGNFYRGIGPSAMRSMLASTIFFSSYQSIMGMIKQGEKPTTKENSIATLLASLINTTLTHPVEVIKTRLEGAKEQKSAGTVLSAILKKEGFFALTKGLLIKEIMAPVKIAWPYFVFQEMKKYLDTPAKKEVPEREEVRAVRPLQKSFARG